MPFKGLYFRRSLERPVALQYLQVKSFAKAIKMKLECVLVSFDSCWEDQFSCRGGRTITNPTPVLSHKHSIPYARPSMQTHMEQQGQEPDARQTNDTCYRTKTFQNNFINSVTFLLCTSVQPNPLSLLQKIDNACFCFNFS